jgi:hypothetical protein
VAIIGVYIQSAVGRLARGKTGMAAK